MKWALACLALAFGGWLCLSSSAAHPAEESSSTDDRVMSSDQFRWQGAAACSAAACHGGNETKGSKRSEYSTWIDHDAHARAYSVLFSERSRRIATNLHLRELAHESQTCLPCHASSPPDAHRAERFQLSDGVSCESCHGASEKWLAEHTLAGWQSKNVPAKEALGFVPTKDLLVRAKVCVACHVGRGDADVNHDLIAAGHPRLAFEYSCYLTAIAKHWSERDERARYPDFDARAWLIGQATTAQAALELLADRTNRTWPEFGEYDCRACHHDLTGEPPRVFAADLRGEAGGLRWNDAFVTLLPRALGVGADGDDPAFTKALEELRNEMNRPLPDVAPTARRARLAADRLRNRVATDPAKPLDPVVLRRLFVVLWDDLALIRHGDHAASQRYQALAALHRTLADIAPEQVDPDWTPSLRRLAEELRTPPSSFNR